MLVVLTIAAYVAYNNYLDTEETAPLTTNGISFICEDGRHFVAEFNPDFSQVNVVVDGVVEHSLSRSVDSELYRYADNDYVYLFVGEEAEVTGVASGNTTICSQPFDPNNAPHNFGDRGEGAGIQQDALAAVIANIVGKWQSVDDENFIREFQAGGVAVDSYEGMATEEGTWEVFDTNSGVETDFPQEENAVYIRMTMGGGTEGPLHFKLTKLTPEDLELIYMERGGVLRFSYVGS